MVDRGLETPQGASLAALLSITRCGFGDGWRRWSFSFLPLAGKPGW